MPAAKALALANQLQAAYLEASMGDVRARPREPEAPT